MQLNSSKEKLKGKINNHLRNVTRQLITFDTLEETLNYLLESFYMGFTCDLVGIILKEEGRLVPKAWIGDQFNIDSTLNLEISKCAPNLLEDALWWPNDKQEDHCDFREGLKKEQLSTWFTVPLRNNNNSFGLCVIGFRDFVPLVLEAEQIFAEFGHDVAIAMDLAKDKEKQKRKIKGIEWIKENIFPGSSIEQVIEKVIERAVKGTPANGACIYLYDEVNHCFVINPPVYGTIHYSDKIEINTEQTIINYFQFVEKAGGKELTVPLNINLKTIGVLYVTTDKDRLFSEEDLEFFKFLSDFVSMQIENARLYRYEFESKKRLETLLENHQELVKKTVEGKDLYSITKTISAMLDCSILLYDRFLRPLTSYYKEEELHLSSHYESKVLEKKAQITQHKTREFWIDDQNASLSAWPIVSGTDLLGYLVVCIEQKKVDRVLRLTMDYALNVFAIEFIKQKLVLDAKEQVKESFVNQLFSESIENQEKIIQYATLINWNILESHRVAVLSFEIGHEKNNEPNLVVVEGYKSWLWDQLKTNLNLHYSNIIYTRKGNEFILIMRIADEKKNSTEFWAKLFQRIKELVKKESPLTKIYLGIGDPTHNIPDYYFCYVKAVKAKNVVSHRYYDGGYSFYDDLGSYTILNNTNDPLAAKLFVKKNLSPLLRYSETNNIDLFSTLEVFLKHNGNYRESSKELYIHRSTLEYRIERISELLNININDAETRFELMMAFKLYNLFDFSRKQLL
ncbi:PucR family transcriptional regulator [Cytobacillus depressus]|uniref:PucR family transcriptional regulator n=1 Tax=Cytobacillus depressus TaxID=1602942 RepID=A0A6L3V2K4_9BACI|nr:helix-turn-helix domain-containing protein [Cytobacillus depressus]KAB2330457.1 PucR family transcriptional regulator [Cytobacillus depressus]